MNEKNISTEKTTFSFSTKKQKTKTKTKTKFLLLADKEISALIFDWTFNGTQRHTYLHVPFPRYIHALIN